MTSTIKRYGVFLVGLFIASLGVAFSTKAGLGTSPVASVPFSASLVNHTLSFGWWLNLMSVVQILVQVAVLRGKCNYVEIGIQTVLAFCLRHPDGFFLPPAGRHPSCWLRRPVRADAGGVRRAGAGHMDSISGGAWRCSQARL